jgi:F-type H+-transporting ATPase subunit delta
MITDAVTTRYTLTLFKSSIAEDNLESVNKDMLSISRIFSDNPALEIFLNNPVISAESKLNVLQKTFKSSISELSDRLLILLYHKKRLEFLRKIAHHFESVYNEHHNLISGIIFSAKLLTPDQIQKISDKFAKDKNKKFVLSNRVDPKLIGGFKIQLGDTIIDWSIKNKLESLKAKLLAS